MSQKVLVAGTGLSGISAAKLLLDMGGEVVLYDSNPELDAEELKHEFDEDARITIVLGELKRTDLLGVEMCVISPGIPLEAPFVAVLDEAKIPIWSEIQLAYQCAKGRLAAITGTNGKTTTTALTGEIMKAYYESVFVVGNIGIPYTQVAMETEDDSVTVAEVSSFQLETIMYFRPDVSAILNITPDHLNRHHTMECYIAVKESITSNQTEEDTCVLNYDDKVLREFGQSEELKPKVIFFSSRQKLDDGYYLDGDMIYYAKNKKAEAVLDVRELNLLGRHNYENVMAAIAISRAMGVPMETIVKVAKEFKAVEHRIEFVLERSGVKYYNDSIASSPSRTIAGLRSFPEKVILIAGGYDKHIPYDVLGPEICAHVKKLFLGGTTGQKIRDAVERCPEYDPNTLEIVDCGSFKPAVRAAAAAAKPGDVVLMSPASAAFDQFKNFMERGKTFKAIVNGWRE